MKRLGFILGLGLVANFSVAQDWKDYQVPANAGKGNVWELQADISDDFNYQFDAVTEKTTFADKWTNFYHNHWDGPGTTYWKYNHVSVDGSDLLLKASRWYQSSESAPMSPWPNKMGKPEAGINAGCITSTKTVQYPVFVEAAVSVANITLASDVWLLSSDDWQEIDIIECYGGADNGNAYFAEFIHLSHHSFERSDDIIDYQPRDRNSWWARSDVDSWGEYCWNNGDRKYVRVGVNWISPFHFEYYVDGELVRVLYHKAFATKIGNTWYYTYPSMTNGDLDMDGGYQKVTQYATSSAYSFETLEAASSISTTSVIDPYNHQGGSGMNKAMDIIINVESQDWHVDANRTPTDADLLDDAKNTMKVDWIRVYKPVEGTGINDVESQGISVYPNPNSGRFTIRFPKEVENQTVYIYTVQGRQVFAGVISGNQHEVVLNTQNKGVFFLRLNYNGKSLQKKLMII
ncbi:T9SS type A sorting domain-containing protein [Carboxylicivirga sediminis]|uniref:T9SS type A sorting domain-containing protein n=1 Tax=Carboxylicivirga sediminis TaxID=2006564 RepID=A0A941F0B8_9BACT|nr:T9SS type A sorting domain-containing protein [Carboxylicivirga sediminis]MBR8534023.1 T9SS type A sorting domain-containing protein [Carboxylicivirga sediminis]